MEFAGKTKFKIYFSDIAKPISDLFAELDGKPKYDPKRADNFQGFASLKVLDDFLVGSYAYVGMESNVVYEPVLETNTIAVKNVKYQCDFFINGNILLMTNDAKAQKLLLAHHLQEFHAYLASNISAMFPRFNKSVDTIKCVKEEPLKHIVSHFKIRSSNALEEYESFPADDYDKIDVVEITGLVVSSTGKLNKITFNANGFISVQPANKAETFTPYDILDFIK